MRRFLVTSLRPTTLARDLRAFFSEHMPLTRGLSPNTIQSYRDTLMLFLRFLQARHECSVIELDFDHLTPEILIGFLDHLESERGNCVSTRNSRLAAVHSFARFAATRHPEHLELCQRLLAVPVKRCSRSAVEYLEANELRAILDCIDRCTAEGRRDYALLLAMFNTGARVQEILDVRPTDLQLERPFHVRLRGKGRKERLCPIWPSTAEQLRALLRDIPLEGDSTKQLFRNRRGEPLTRFGVRYLLQKYVRLAHPTAPSLTNKKVNPHTLRHTAAVHLLQAGVDLVSISHLLGHVSVETTNRYLAIDLETKRAALEQAGPLIEEAPTLRHWRTDEALLVWLESL